MTLPDLQGCYRLAGKVIPWLLRAALVLFIIGLYLGFFESKNPAWEGYAYRIMFIHVPSAWLSLFLCVLMAVMSGIGLFSKHLHAYILAQAIAPTGAVMAVVALFSGAFWGRPAWGFYWTWDARLISELLLLILYLGVIALHASIKDLNRADRFVGVINLLGMALVPIVYHSAEWWNTQHQGITIAGNGAPLPSAFWLALVFMVLSGLLYVTGVILARSRSIILERERRKDWTHEAALEGTL